MACIDYGTVIELAPRETVTLPDVRGATLRITRGTVWITQENDTQDTVLRPGDSWTVERNGLTILEAQSDVSLCVVGRRIEALLTGRKHALQRDRHGRGHANSWWHSSPRPKGARCRMCETAWAEHPRRGGSPAPLLRMPRWQR